MTVKLTNDEKFSLSIAVWLSDDCYNHAPVEGPYYSATGLLKPIRMLVLDKRVKAHQQDTGVEERIDISRYIPSCLGTAIHSSIEGSWKYRYKKAMWRLRISKDMIDRVLINPTTEEAAAKPDAICVYMEQRAYKKVMGITVGGMFDFVGDGILEDFKSMGVYGYMMGGKDWEQMMQGSIYRWLNPEIIKANYMLIQQIFTDWSKLDATIKKKRGYPQTRILSKKLTLMSLKETEAWIREKLTAIQALQNVPEEELPRCEQKDLWQDDTKYKYYKNPNKTARSTANFDDYTLAHARLLKDGEMGVIKEFQGKVKRCGYCNAFEICTQKDEYINQGILQLP